MFYDVYQQQKQVRWYDQTRVPPRSVIETALSETYELVASKQNLMPYKIYVIEQNQTLNQGLYNLSQEILSSTSANYNLLTAPYQFIYTVRLAEGSQKVREWVAAGHSQPPMNPELYKNREVIKNTNIEIGMHAIILSKLLIEQGIDVSYTLCFEPRSTSWADNGFDFIDDEVQFIMSAGYEDTEKYFDAPEVKPPLSELITWVCHGDHDNN